MSIQQGPLDLSTLSNTACVVTGAGKLGIGFGIGEVAADLNMTVVLMDLEPGVIDKAVATFKQRHPNTKCLGFACDVSNEVKMKEIALEIKQAVAPQRLGAVFANAGIIHVANGILGSDIQKCRQELEVNVVGVLSTMQAFVPILRESKETSIFCSTASIGGVMRAVPSMVNYCATKHAVVVLTEALSFELAKLNEDQIRVHVCCPCLAASDMAFGGASPSEVQSMSQKIFSLYLTPYNHGKQVFDRIAAGEFYMICENKRPYVDHDFEFGAESAINHRLTPLLKPPFQKALDNSGAKLRPAKTFDCPLRK